MAIQCVALAYTPGSEMSQKHAPKQSWSKPLWYKTLFSLCYPPASLTSACQKALSHCYLPFWWLLCSGASIWKSLSFVISGRRKPWDGWVCLLSVYVCPWHSRDVFVLVTGILLLRFLRLQCVHLLIQIVPMEPVCLPSLIISSLVTFIAMNHFNFKFSGASTHQCQEGQHNSAQCKQVFFLLSATDWHFPKRGSYKLVLIIFAPKRISQRI